MENKSQHYFFLALLLGVAVLTAFIFLPYLTSLLIAVVFSVVFRPLHRGISKVFSKGHQSSSISTFITLLIVAVLVITPMIFLAKQIYVESENLYYSLTDEGERSTIIQTLNDFSASLSNRLYGVFPAYNFDSFNITKYVQNFLEWSFANLDTIFSSVTRFAIQIFIMLFALFYLLRDGGKLKQDIIAISPLADKYDDKIFAKLKQAIRSVVVGSLVIGFIQGILTGLGFYIFGVPNPALWGSLAVVAALIPGIGTSLVLIPGILYLFFMSTHLHALGLLIWGIVAVGLIDNYLGPLMINRGVHIHPFLILLAVIGGLSLFGPIGFIAGPLILALLFALLEIYKTTR
ncbi:MAG TPA: AI-2E family transporter [Candidatus Paceibacterota bacterium]